MPLYNLTATGQAHVAQPIATLRAANAARAKRAAAKIVGHMEAAGTWPEGHDAELTGPTGAVWFMEEEAEWARL